MQQRHVDLRANGRDGNFTPGATGRDKPSQRRRYVRRRFGIVQTDQKQPVMRQTM